MKRCSTSYTNGELQMECRYNYIISSGPNVDTIKCCVAFYSLFLELQNCTATFEDTLPVSYEIYSYKLMQELCSLCPCTTMNMDVYRHFRYNRKI